MYLVLKQFIILLIILNISFSTKLIKEAKLKKNLSSFMFGSCNKIVEDRPSQLFSRMQHQQSEVFVWLGDAAYVDKRIIPFIWQPDEQINVQKKFKQAYDDPYYKAFRNSNKKILGIYDDHDINMNDANKHNPTKEWAKQEYLNFIDEPQDSNRRNNNNGIYESYYLGDNRVKLILLDVRYNRDLEIEDTLGDTQWEWLEQELQDPNPLIFFIGSGVQVLPDDRISETFLQNSKLRLLKLIKKTQAKVILLSGDIHTAEFLYQPCSKQYLGYDLIEFTSSGINLDVQSDIMYFFSSIFEGILTSTHSNPENRRFLTLNYAKIDIQWSDIIEESVIKLDLFGIYDQDEPIMSKQLYLNDLDTSNSNSDEDFSCPYLEISGKMRLLNQIFNFIFMENVFVCIFFVLVIINMLLFLFCTTLTIKKLLFKKKNQNNNLNYKNIKNNQAIDKKKTQ